MQVFTIFIVKLVMASTFSFGAQQADTIPPPAPPTDGITATYDVPPPAPPADATIAE